MQVNRSEILFSRLSIQKDYDINFRANHTYFCLLSHLQAQKSKDFESPREKPRKRKVKTMKQRRMANKLRLKLNQERIKEFKHMKRSLIMKQKRRARTLKWRMFLFLLKVRRKSRQHEEVDDDD